MADAKPRPHPEGSVKDTVESILVAFILAFVFRAFVVEAFVIPTGSMAPTLLGAHMHFTCADCGYKYTVNYPTGSDLSVPPNAPQKLNFGIYCPNCGFSVPAGPPGAQPVPDTRNQPPVHYGDRILVLKYRYLIAEPQRWDVVVFKAPDVVENAARYTTNYIKRLIGRPGESVMMVDGDIYVSTAKPPGDLNDDLIRREYYKSFNIQSKPNHAQEALWRVVYDNDHLPHLADNIRSQTPWRQPWQIDTTGTVPSAPNANGWNVGQDPAVNGRTRVFTFSNSAAGGTIRFNPDANPNPEGAGPSSRRQPFAMTDFLAYDQVRSNREGTLFAQSMVAEERNTVTDLRLTCFYTRQAGDGAFDMTMSKRSDVFVARLTPGKAQIIWKRENGDTVKTYPPVDLPGLGVGSGPVRLDLTSVDYRVSLRVDGKEVASTGDDFKPTGEAIARLVEAEHLGRLAGAEPRVEMSAERQTCKLEHVSLWRDLFYVNDESKGRIGKAASPRNIMVLGDDEFFVMGDNPWISYDARAWEKPVELAGEGLEVAAGRVPRRFLLGKAFFVYWPAGYRPPGLSWGLIPNFGEMRFIH